MPSTSSRKPALASFEPAMITAHSAVEAAARRQCRNDRRRTGVTDVTGAAAVPAEAVVGGVRLPYAQFALLPVAAGWRGTGCFPLTVGHHWLLITRCRSGSRIDQHEAVLVLELRLRVVVDPEEPRLALQSHGLAALSEGRDDRAFLQRLLPSKSDHGVVGGESGGLDHAVDQDARAFAIRRRARFGAAVIGCGCDSRPRPVEIR